MRFFKTAALAALLFALVSCGARTEPSPPGRADSCILEAQGYSIRVRRGERRFEFVSPDGISGASVAFGEGGSCSIGAPDGVDGALAVPVADGRGYHDWLVLAYPEDFAPEGALAADGSGKFEFDGASFSIASDGSCSVSRNGLERSAIRVDEK